MSRRTMLFTKQHHHHHSQEQQHREHSPQTSSRSSSSFGSDPNVSALYPAVLERVVSSASGASSSLSNAAGAAATAAASRRQPQQHPQRSLQQRFQAKHEPVGHQQEHDSAEVEIAPPGTALQFVPALEQSSGKTPPRRSTFAAAAAVSSKQSSSWDTATTDGDEKKEETPTKVLRNNNYHKWNNGSKSNNHHIITHSPGGNSSASSTINSYNSSNARQQQSSPQHLKGTGRIARIASLFNGRSNNSNNNSHRGIIAEQQQQQEQLLQPLRGGHVAASTAAAAAPVSPVQSSSTYSSSDGYVGWPGTQDKGGATVPVAFPPSSFDDSSTAGPTTTAAAAAVSSQQQQQQQQFQQQGEMSRWTGGGGYSSSGASPGNDAAARLSPSRKSLSAMRYAQSEFAGISTTTTKTRATTTTRGRITATKLAAPAEEATNTMAASFSSDSSFVNFHDVFPNSNTTPNSSHNNQSSPLRTAAADDLWGKAEEEVSEDYGFNINNKNNNNNSPSIIPLSFPTAASPLTTTTTTSAASKTSSAYFQVKDAMHELAYPDFLTTTKEKTTDDDDDDDYHRRGAAAMPGGRRPEMATRTTTTTPRPASSLRPRSPTKSRDHAAASSSSSHRRDVVASTAYASDKNKNNNNNIPAWKKKLLQKKKRDNVNTAATTRTAATATAALQRSPSLGELRPDQRRKTTEKDDGDYDYQYAMTTTSRRPNVAVRHRSASPQLEKKEEAYQYTTTTECRPDVAVRHRSASPQLEKKEKEYRFTTTERHVRHRSASPQLEKKEEYRYEYAAVGRRPNVAAAHHQTPVNPQPPTKDALAANDRLSPIPHMPFHGAKGYRGFIEKTKEVPSLMDAMDSDSMSSSKATSTYSSGILGANRRESDGESDVFDGLSTAKESDVFDNLSIVDGGKSTSTSPRKGVRPRVSYPARIAEEGGGDDDDNINSEQPDGEVKLVVLAGGLATIQTDQCGFSNRRTASDYDENLTNSDIDQYGYAKTPGLIEMITAGQTRDSSLRGIQGNIGGTNRRLDTSAMVGLSHETLTASESGSSLFTDPYEQERSSTIDGDLSEYRVSASQMKKVLRKYRKLSDVVKNDISLSDFEREEDEHKSFALFEMRSRIMGKDIERGLERRGGTVVVDDLVTTPYSQQAQRVRDAVIVSKAWRDGTSPKDVINSALLTCRDERTFFIKRSVRADTNTSDNNSTFSGYSATTSQRYRWEPVEWIDDTDFTLYRCPSLGPRHMRGFEMFTIGDCQSILLKLTNERCKELRRDLNEATKRQIEAEYLLKEEGDAGDGMMTEAEMAYLTAMEEVKTISKQLVGAEQAFALVRDRIEQLVAKYEALLAKIETESFAGESSIITYESSYYSEQDSDEDQEKAIWARRAQRAELKAELAAREALLAKQEARMIQEEKQRELEALQQKLFDLQSESSHAIADREHSVTLARSYAMHRNDSADSLPEKEVRIDKDKIDGVKQRFRDRMAAKKGFTTPPDSRRDSGRHYLASSRSSRTVTPSPSPPSGIVRNLFRTAGEEMCQQLDFYERSLRAVESSREG